jgi:CheY-like chemotaxis protein
MAKTILIIDDEKDMRTYLEAVFRKAGYDTETAADGDEGVWLAEARQPDLVTLDVLMPKKSGIKAYRGRSDDFFGDYGDLPKPEAVVEKPIDRDAFVDKVRELIGTP